MHIWWMIFWEKFMYHQNTLKIFSSQYLGKFAVYALMIAVIKQRICCKVKTLMLLGYSYYIRIHGTLWTLHTTVAELFTSVCIHRNTPT